MKAVEITQSFQLLFYVVLYRLEKKTSYLFHEESLRFLSSRRIFRNFIISMQRMSVCVCQNIKSIKHIGITVVLQRALHNNLYSWWEHGWVAQFQLNCNNH